MLLRGAFPRVVVIFITLTALPNTSAGALLSLGAVRAAGFQHAATLNDPSLGRTARRSKDRGRDSQSLPVEPVQAVSAKHPARACAKNPRQRAIVRPKRVDQPAPWHAATSATRFAAEREAARQGCGRDPPAPAR